MRNFFEAVRDLGLIAASALTWFVMVLQVRDGSVIFDLPVIGLYALGVLLSAPVVARPTTGLGAAYGVVFNVVGLLCLGLFRLFLVIWIVGISLIVGVHGIDSPWAIASILWIPVYVGLPAWIAAATSEVEFG